MVAAGNTNQLEVAGYSELRMPSKMLGGSYQVMLQLPLVIPLRML